MSHLLPIWYELGEPSHEYERYHTPFIWMAAWARYFVAYLEQLLDGQVAAKDITVENFRDDFSIWAKNQYKSKSYFAAWLVQYQEGRHRGKNDLRSAVAAHPRWLWNQASTTFTGYERYKIQSATLWKQIMDLKAIKPAHSPDESIRQTIVTPYVYNTFKDLFTTKLEVVDFPQDVASESTGPARLTTSRMLSTKSITTLIQQFLDPGRSFSYQPRRRDVVAFAADEDSQWDRKSMGGKANKSTNIWFGYVNNYILLNSKSPEPKFKLFITWLYSPEHTVLEANGDYPHKHELFFSDHCNCAAPVPLYASDIIGVVDVEFFGGPDTKADCFIRQKYQVDEDDGETEEGGFVTLQPEELTQCRCKRDEPIPWCQVRKKYSVGDTILISTIHEYLEPAVIHAFEDNDMKITIRQLKRRCIDEPTARANEVVYTHSFVSIAPDGVVRPCHVRIFHQYGLDPDFELPSPYDRHGAGDCFFITQEDVNGVFRIIKDSDVPPCKLRPGYLPSGIPSEHRLKGLDLFCGGGNFGRGLEEGGAVDMKWAVDIESAPLHSYQANLEPGSDTALYLGSINNYLKDAIEGRYSNIVARPGQIDFISAGSPCQGFSLANKDRESDKSIQNCSLVSSLATAIDIYRPKYALLENVHQIAGMRRYNGRPGEYNVYATLVSAIVGMGYQCQHFILDSWSYGNGQSRTRLFLAVSAPGVGLLKRPPRSHSHHPDIRNAALYKAPGGKTFGKREMTALTPFKYRTCGEDWAYLPNIHDAHVGVCIPFPDHRTSRVEDKFCRALLAHIPRFPSRQGLVQAIMSESLHPIWIPDYKEEKKMNPNSRAWRRMDKDALCRTITTSVGPQCQYTGTWGHPSESRLITVHEARIAQGFPDHEVLMGKPAQQFKVVGNSVARGVSLAMGLSLRQAYFEGKSIVV
ncbi:S-adenosyl-L-methionine-dependent methyltransferase [Ascodesmis nigricans]|uniref:DNA (cytosine-5-)-methyltransferase n=1 Tax=Ascodesmis nigricans TaxID=341454 RepID=A0A4V3SIJ0_9PEZI|nr:S-adenosyl-L-methionine-dependent methyltransferase [Ascodesmis nigricans]